MLTLSILCGLFATTGIAEAPPPGIGPGLFAQTGLDARATALGGSMVAAAEGPAAPYYNPSTLANADHLSVGGMHSSPYGPDFGVTYQYVSVQGPLGSQTASSRGIGIGLTWMSSGVSDIPLWDDQGLIGTASSQASVYMASIGVPILPTLSVGLSIRYYSATLLEGRGTGFGLDVAACGAFDLGTARLTVALNSQDTAGSVVKWTSLSGETRNIIPWVNKLGVALLLDQPSIVLTTDLDWSPGRPVTETVIHAGVEYEPLPFLQLRAGLRKPVDSEVRLTAGFGMALGDLLSLSYAFSTGPAFADTHLIVIGIDL